MSTPATVVTEILAELGDRLRSDQDFARALDRARDQHSLAPAGWATVERTLLGLRTRQWGTCRWLPRVISGGLEADA